MKRNADLFFAIADRVEFDPDSYCQLFWGRPSSATDCGTVCCIAGHALTLNGYEVSLDRYHNARFAKPHHMRGLTGPTTIANRAATLLGLDHHEASLLFDSEWQPKRKYTVAEALRHLGKGESIDNVTR